MTPRDGAPVPAGEPELLQDCLSGPARRWPERVALVCDGERLTYARLDALSDALAGALAARGVAPGDRVVVLADNTVHAVVSFWAILKAGAVACLLSSQVRPGKLAAILEDCRASALVTDERHTATFTAAAAGCPHLAAVVVSGGLEGARAAGLPGLVSWNDALAAGARGTPPARSAAPGDLAAIIYSSGSTGEPKAACLEHRNMLAASASICEYLAHTERDVILSVLSLSLSYGLYQMITTFRAGARLVLERSFAYPAQVLARMASEEVTGFAGVPMIFAVLLGMKNLAGFDLSRLRYVTNAAAAIPVPHLLRLRDLLPGARIYSMYGQTECARISYLPPGDLERKPDSVGIPIPNTEFWVVDERGARAGPGVVGELVVRGPHVMRGYWERPEATERSLRPGPVPGECVLHTGDLCRMDEEGYLYFAGRMDDIIKCRGEKVSPREVEDVIAGIPGVREVAVIGVPDDLLGQAVKAFIVPGEGGGPTERQVRLECERRLEPYMVPRHVVFVADLPRTGGGKVRKTELQ